MEAFLSRTSKITGFRDRSSGSPPSRKGKRNVQKPRSFPESISDSCSFSSQVSEDSVKLELGSRNPRLVGTPMKKLLEQEMSRETESKRRSPSIIARLMGLDGLPPRTPSQKRQLKSSEDYQKKIASAEPSNRSDMNQGRRSFRKSSKEDQEFKDVFEVMDASKMRTGGYSSQDTGSSNHYESEMAFIKQKFTDAKRLSTDKKLQQSKEFRDALEVLDSNKDLLLKFLQQPDSLFTKHVHDLQGPVHRLHRSHASGVRSSHAPKHDSNEGRQISHKQLPCRTNSRAPHRHLDRIPSHPQKSLAANKSLKPSKHQSEEKYELATQPTKIVVLKPNLGRNFDRNLSPLHTFGDARTDSRLPCSRNRDSELWCKNSFTEDARHKSRESRELAKEITKQMRNSLGSGSKSISTSRFRGYAGDESSCDVSGSDSENELAKPNKVISRSNFNCDNGYVSSSSRSSVSSVSMEAKKRLSERWKLSHESEEVKVASLGSTLGEMLSIPGGEASPADYKGESHGRRLSGKAGSRYEPTEWIEPLGISSRDGWKDVRRSRSLSAGNSNMGSCDDMNPRANKLTKPKEPIKQERRSLMGTYSYGEGYTNSRCNSRRSPSLPCIELESENTSPATEFAKCREKNYFEGQPLPEKRIHEDFNSIVDSLVNVGVSSESSPMEFNDLPSGDLDALRFQESSGAPSDKLPSDHPIPEQQSPAGVKESDQPSPNSILEGSFPDDDVSSGSECFESLSADLHGLRMQLQLLKLESEASYEEGPMLVSSDEDTAETSSVFRNDYIITPIAEENWESLYLSDVLFNSGFFSNTTPEMFMARRHSPDCPVNPSVFEQLEYKYCGHLSSKSERRLLFDRINSKLLEIFFPFTQHPWLRPPLRVSRMCNKKGLEDTLLKSLTVRDKQVSMEEMVMEPDLQWMDLGEDVDVIGKEIERLLTDELVEEIVRSL